MPDMEKVIKGLEELSGFLFKEYGKAQAEEASLYYDRFLTVDNALALLKEQEAVVRCKDCKYSNNNPRNRIYREGIVLCERTDHGRDENWFCADGVKRDD